MFASLRDGLEWSRKATPRRLRNAAALWTSFQRAKRTSDPRIGGLPFSISFEPTTACNLRCPECPSGLRSFTRPTGNLRQDLFARVMDESLKAGTRLLGDTSAVFQRNRADTIWRALIETERWHPRLLHGSDHPLPGVMPLFSLPRLVKAGLLAEADAPILQRVREHNPLLFDLILKRRLKSGNVRLAAGVFEARALATT